MKIEIGNYIITFTKMNSKNADRLTWTVAITSLVAYLVLVGIGAFND